MLTVLKKIGINAYSNLKIIFKVKRRKKQKTALLQTAVLSGGIKRVK